MPSGPDAWKERARVAATQLAGAAEFPLFANDAETLLRLVDASQKGDNQLRAVKLFDRTGRTLVNASLQYLGIVFSVAYGVLLFDDPVTWMALAGMALIVVAGLAATLLRARTTPRPDEAADTLAFVARWTGLQG